MSVKAVLDAAGHVPLLYNERDEWELPGGRLEVDEEPEMTVVREVKEELDLDVQVEALVDAWTYRPATEPRAVLIVVYRCELLGEPSRPDLRISSEHRSGAWFAINEITKLQMPAGYKRSIARALARAE